jgi:hypothetical protein
VRIRAGNARKSEREAPPSDHHDQRQRHVGCSGRRTEAEAAVGRLRIINTPMDQELTAELNSFEVDFTSAGNMRVDVRSKDYHGDLVIATALALWSAVGKPPGRIEVGTLENWYA